MKKLIFFFVSFALFTMSTSSAMGDSQSQQDNSQNNASIEQAKKDYAVFLQKLSEMGKQYSQVTGQVKEVVKEQGVPVWDDAEGKFKISHDVNFSENGAIHETDKEIKVALEKPGLRKNSIHIAVEDDKVLHLRAYKKALEAGQPDEVVDEKIQLPEQAVADHPKAQYEDGILTVTFSKKISPKKSVDVPVQ